MKIYLAGPMTGIPEHNYPAFHAAAAMIRARGHDVVSPAEINAGMEELGWAACMRRDIPELLKCDAVAVLVNWQKSRGALLEVKLASALGLPVIDTITWQSLAIGRSLIIRELLAFPPDAALVESLHPSSCPS